MLKIITLKIRATDVIKKKYYDVENIKVSVAMGSLTRPDYNMIRTPKVFEHGLFSFVKVQKIYIAKSLLFM